MSRFAPRGTRLSPRRVRGFSLVELAVAMTVALFLLGGLLTVLQNMRRAQTTQTGLSQLQDNQRIAMTLLNNVLQSAGYFPDPTVNSTGKRTASGRGGRHHVHSRTSGVRNFRDRRSR